MGKKESVASRAEASDVERFADSSTARKKLLVEEELILDVTEMLSAAMEECRISRSELADRLGKTKGFVSQVLAGNRNLTLRTIADIADALGFRVRIRKESLAQPSRSPAVVETHGQPRKPKILRYG